MKSLSGRKRKHAIPYIQQGSFNFPINYIDEKIESILYRGRRCQKPFFSRENENQSEMRTRFLSQKEKIISDKKSKLEFLRNSSDFSHLNVSHLKGIRDLVKSSRITDIRNLDDILSLSKKKEHLNLLIGTMQCAGWHLGYADTVIDSLDYEPIRDVCEDDEKEKYLTHICESSYWSYDDIGVARDLTDFVNTYESNLLTIPMKEIGKFTIGHGKNCSVPKKIRGIVNPLLEDRIHETLSNLNKTGSDNISNNILSIHSKGRGKNLLYKLIDLVNEEQDLETVENMTKKVLSLVKTSKNVPTATIYLQAVEKLKGIMSLSSAYLKVNDLLKEFDNYYMKNNLPRKVDQVYQDYLEE